MSSLPHVNLFGRTAGGDSVQILVDDDGRVVTSVTDTSSEMGLNVMNYGATGDGTTDDTAAFQATFDAAYAAPTVRAVLIPAPDVYYKITSPILDHADNHADIRGESGKGLSHGTTVYGTGFCGPVFHMRGSTPNTNLTYGTSLATGAGASVVMTTTPSTRLDFNDGGVAMRLNGLAAFSVEFFFKISAFTADFQSHLLESRGSINGLNTTSAFAVKVDTAGHLLGYVNVGGSTTTITSAGTLSLNTVYQVELSYDGTTVRLFYGIPGATATLAGTVTVSGTVSQAFEQLPLGGVRQNWPHGDLLSEAFAGAIDSIRFSNNARHTAVFTASTVKFISDSHTLLLENFDNETADFSIVYTNDGSAYLNKYGLGASQSRGGDVSGIEVRSRQSAFYLNGLIQGYFHDMTIRGGVYGINTNNDTFLDRYSRIWFYSGDGSSLVALQFTSQSGICHLEGLDFEGWPVCFMGNSGSGVLTTSYFHSGTAQYHAVIREGSWLLQGNAFSNEDAGVGTYFKSNLWFSSVDSVVVDNCAFECFSVSTGKAIQVGTGNKSITVVGGNIYSHASATEMIEVLTAPSNPILVLNTQRVQAAVPWSLSGTVRAEPPSIAGAVLVASGFGTTPVVATGSTYAATKLTIGSGGVASSGVLTMPFPALHGWNCTVTNLTAAAAHTDRRTIQTATSTTTVTLESQINSTCAATAWGAADVLLIQCEPY